jgi:hypothetical protein
MSSREKKVLAISSGGGHWVQLLRLRPAFEGCQVTFATVRSGYQADIQTGDFAVVTDCNRTKKLQAIRCVLDVLWLLLRLRPDVIVSTGALPGYVAIRLGRWFGARTIWVDSVANAEELSMSGQMAGPHVTLWLTQWPHLQREDGPQFVGSVL